MDLSAPDPPSRCHLPFDRPFDKPFDKLTVLSSVEGLTVPSNVEGLMALSRSALSSQPKGKAEGRRCFRSLLPAAYSSYVSVVAPWRLASNTFLVPRDRQNPTSFLMIQNLGGGFWVRVDGLWICGF